MRSKCKFFLQFKLYVCKVNEGKAILFFSHKPLLHLSFLFLRRLRLTKRKYFVIFFSVKKNFIKENLIRKYL